MGALNQPKSQSDLWASPARVSLIKSLTQSIYILREQFGSELVSNWLKETQS
jgi:hypothetical protein